MPKKATSKQVAAPKRPRSAASKARRLTIPKRLWYNPLTWRHPLPVTARKPLPKARILFWRVLKIMWRNWKVFLGIAAIYTIFTLVLVRGFSGNSEVSMLKATLDTLLDNTGGKITSSFITFTALLTSSDTGATTAAAQYQSAMIAIFSLAFIWVFRQLNSGQLVRIRDSFYQSMYPLIPFVLVIVLLGLQLVPLTIGGSLYSMAVTYNIAVEPWERIALAALLLVLAVWSIRVVTATIFALYIVTLPNMTPLRAYRTARQLVYGRRLLIWRKLIFLPVILLLTVTVLIFPLIFFFTPAAVWAFFGLSMLALPVIHGYMYELYREML